MKEQTVKRWNDRIQAAASSEMGEAPWCRINGVNPVTFKCAKWKLKRQGLLSALCQDQAKGFLPPSRSPHPLVAIYRPEGVSRSLCFVLQPVSLVSCDQFYWLIRSQLGMDPACGDWFLFLRRDRRVLYSFRGTAAGFTLSRTWKHRGTIPWPTQVSPEGSANLSVRQLEELRTLVCPDGR